MDTPLFPDPPKSLRRLLLAVHLVVATAFFARVVTASTLDGASIEKPCGTLAGQLAKAEESLKAAAAFRQEAVRYRRELEKEKKGIAILPKGPENPWWRKTRLHYEPLIEVSERHAAEAERLTEYHLLRATELQGR